ncbi:hypothetical protein B484DRAFT_36242, partial [Ochromonadaceae sp. CCMP2298]
MLYVLTIALHLYTNLLNLYTSLYTILQMHRYIQQCLTEEDAKNLGGFEEEKGEEQPDPQAAAVRTGAEEVIKLTKNVGKIPTFDIVLVGERLFFFHCLKLFFSLNLVRCGEKGAFRAVVGGEKAALAGVKMQILRYVYVCIYVCVYLFLCMYVFVFVWVCMYMCLCVCGYVCVYVYFVGNCVYVWVCMTYIYVYMYVYICYV